MKKEEIEYLKENIGLISYKFSGGDLLITIREDFYTYDALEDYLAEELNVHYDELEEDDSAQWILIFRSPSEQVEKSITSFLDPLLAKISGQSSG